LRILRKNFKSSPWLFSFLLIARNSEIIRSTSP
jgi:hypothetical protein